jgi:hypothetical protein
MNSGRLGVEQLREMAPKSSRLKKAVKTGFSKTPVHYDSNPYRFP